jgi:hypothetical protein
MRNTKFYFLLLPVIFFISCKCRFEYNAIITAYDATKCACCGGYQVSYYEYDVQSKKQVEKKFIVKVLTGDVGKSITPHSKFPVKGMAANLVVDETCFNIIDTMALYPAMEQCPK